MTEGAIMIGLYFLQVARENDMTILAVTIVLVGAVTLGLYLLRNRR
jgi:hypothetical protein